LHSPGGKTEAAKTSKGEHRALNAGSSLPMYFVLAKDIGKAEPFLLKYGLSKTRFVIVIF